MCIRVHYYHLSRVNEQTPFLSFRVRADDFGNKYDLSSLSLGGGVKAVNLHVANSSFYINVCTPLKDVDHCGSSELTTNDAVTASTTSVTAAATAVTTSVTAADTAVTVAVSTTSVTAAATAVTVAVSTTSVTAAATAVTVAADTATASVILLLPNLFTFLLSLLLILLSKGKGVQWK